MPDETRHESADLEDYTSPGTRTRGMRTWTGSSSMTARTPGQAGWEPRMREPSRTARPTWSHTTPESTAVRRPRRRRPSTQSTTTITTSAPPLTASLSAPRTCARSCRADERPFRSGRSTLRMSGSACLTETRPAPAACLSGVWLFHMADEKDVITVAAATPIDAAMNTTRTAGEPANTGGAESAGAEALDLLLPHATLGVLRRVRPDASMARCAFGLARRPGAVAARSGKLAAELASIAAGRSAVAPQPRDRRFADPAWSGNPLLKRILQTYLAVGQTAGGLLADAELDWRDDTR